ncbi:MAG: hypothetical protein ROO73_03155 [Roseivirga sp.]
MKNKPILLLSSLSLIVLSGIWGCGKPNRPKGGGGDTTQPKVTERPKEEVLATAKQHAEELLKDSGKAEAWLSDAFQIYGRSRQDDKYLKAARAATICAYNAMKSSPVPQSILKVIEQVAQCAIQCRQASVSYSAGTALGSLESFFDILKDYLLELDQASKCLEAEKAKTRSSTLLQQQIENKIKDRFQCACRWLHQIMEYSMEAMLGKNFHVVGTSEKEIKEQQYGASSMAIVEEAAKVWNAEISREKAGGGHEWQVDPTTPEGQQKLVHSAVCVAILLAEALKAHYEDTEMQNNLSHLAQVP